MRVLGLEWIGTRTPAFAETVAFFRDVLGLRLGIERSAFVRFDLPDGASLEVFRPGGEDDHPYFTTGPVIGFQVPEMEVARERLRATGCELLGTPGGRPGEYRWQHFRAPDGNVYEVVDDPKRRPLPKARGPLGVRGFGWAGVQTARYDAMRAFLLDTLELAVVEEESGLAEFQFPNGHVFEIFRPGSDYDHPHLTTGPMPGLLVEDLDRAEAALRSAGIEVLQRRRYGPAGWSHFRAPDGSVYELKRFADDRAPGERA